MAEEGKVLVQAIFTAALIAYTFYKSAAAFLLLFLVTLYLGRKKTKAELREKRLWTLQQEFKECIGYLSAYLGAGYAVETALSCTLREAEKVYGKEGMMTRELSYINRELCLNRTLEALLAEFAERSGLPDIRNFAEVFAIAKRSGGDLSAVIERTAGVIRDRTAVTEELKTLTAAKRYEQQVMTVLPFAMVFYINLTSAGFLDVMYESLPGQLVMTACLALLLLSAALARRVLRIEL